MNLTLTVQDLQFVLTTMLLLLNLALLVRIARTSQRSGCSRDKAIPDELQRIVALKLKLQFIDNQIISTLTKDPFFGPYLTPEEQRTGGNLWIMEKVSAYLKDEMPDETTDEPILRALIKRAIFLEHISQSHPIIKILHDREEAHKEMNALGASL